MLDEYWSTLFHYFERKKKRKNILVSMVGGASSEQVLREWCLLFFRFHVVSLGDFCHVCVKWTPHPLFYFIFSSCYILSLSETVTCRCPLRDPLSGAKLLEEKAHNIHTESFCFKIGTIRVTSQYTNNKQNIL